MVALWGLLDEFWEPHFVIREEVKRKRKVAAWFAGAQDG